MLVNETKNDVEWNTQVSLRLSKKIRIGFALLGVALMVLGAVLITVDQLFAEEHHYFPALFLMLFGLLFVIYVAFFYDRTLRAASRKLMQGKESTATYTFGEDGYEIATVTSDGITSNAKGGYESFLVCKEYKDLWLLCINKATVFGVSKNGMKEGTAEELTALLMRRLGTRYKTCCKRKEK